jgi:hypothetical protein
MELLEAGLKAGTVVIGFAWVVAFIILASR